MGVIDCSLGFYGNLHGESLGGRVWLDAFDRLSWVESCYTVVVAWIYLRLSTYARMFYLPVMFWDV